MLARKIITETLVAFKQGAKLARIGNRGPSYQTIFRWAKTGLKDRHNPNGPPVTLEYCYLGGRLYTSVEAFGRWMEKLN